MRVFKDAICKVVDAYRKGKPEDYLKVVNDVRIRSYELKTKFGEVKQDGVVHRILGSIPTELEMTITKNVSLECLKWWKTQEASRWFFKKYPEFRITSDI